MSFGVIERLLQDVFVANSPIGDIYLANNVSTYLFWLEKLLIC